MTGTLGWRNPLRFECSGAGSAIFRIHDLIKISFGADTCLWLILRIWKAGRDIRLSSVASDCYTHRQNSFVTYKHGLVILKTLPIKQTTLSPPRIATRIARHDLHIRTHLIKTSRLLPSRRVPKTKLSRSNSTALNKSKPSNQKRNSSDLLQLQFYNLTHRIDKKSGFATLAAMYRTSHTSPTPH